MYGIPKDTTAGSQGYGEHGEGNGGKEPEEEKENIEMKGVEHQWQQQKKIERKWQQQKREQWLPQQLVADEPQQQQQQQQQQQKPPSPPRSLPAPQPQPPSH